jgi:hypothetical protein
MLGAIAINIMMGTNGLLEFIADNHARTLGRGTTSEQQDPRTSAWIGGFEKTNGNTKGDAGAT